MAWRPPELPKVEKLPQKTEADAKPRYFARGVAGFAAVAMALMAGVGFYNALKSGGGVDFKSLFIILPVVFLLRYCVTGVIKGN